MDTKHTPGPWVHDDGHIFTENKHRFNGVYNSIATVHEIYKDDKTPQGNAKLIAAAPELLEALQLAYNLLEENQGEAKWYLRGHFNKINEAIKKATE